MANFPLLPNISMLDLSMKILRVNFPFQGHVHVNRFVIVALLTVKGLKANAYSNIAQRVVTLKTLFRDVP